MASPLDDIDDRFILADNYIQTNHSKFSKQDLLIFYAYFKQATVGKCDVAKPGIFRIQERAKWDAWNNLQDLDQDSAKASYIQHLSELQPAWDDSKHQKITSTFGNTVSRPQIFEEDMLDSEKSIQDYIKEGDAGSLTESLKELQELNSLDENGLGLIHWAADHGNAEILKILLNQINIDINLQDSEGQSALHYASSCEHVECVKILLENNADKTILDNDGNTSLDVASTVQIKHLLS